MITEKEIREMLENILDKDLSDVSDEALLVEDIGLDSLAALEILAGLENKYGIQIPAERLTDIVNIRSTVDLAREMTGEVS